MKPLHDIRLIVCDLDGTLLDSRKRLDFGVVKQMRERHLPITIASGRDIVLMREYLDELSITLPFIANNGADLFVNGKRSYRRFIPREDLQAAFSLLQQHGIGCIVSADESFYAVKDEPDLAAFKARFAGRAAMAERKDYTGLLDKHVFKLAIARRDVSFLQPIVEQINAGCKEAQFVRSEDNAFIMTHRLATKGNALQQVLRHLHLTAEQVLVFGDNYNDISMFEQAAHSVAMANANETVRRHAAYVTKSNDENGVSWFLEHYLA